MSERIIDDPAQEILDVVDENDNVVGQSSRQAKEWGADKGLYPRLVCCFLFNDKGQLWIPTRSNTKRTNANALDFSAGGYVQAGESYTQAAIAEIAEELKMEPGTYTLKNLGVVSPLSYSVGGFFGCFIIHTNKTPDFNTDDFGEGKWMTISQIRTQIDIGTPAKKSLVPILNFLELQEL